MPPATTPVVRNPWNDVLDVAGLNSTGDVNVNGDINATGDINGTFIGSFDAANLTGVVAIGHGGTGLSSAGIALRYLRAKANSISQALEYAPTWGVNPLDYVFSISPGVDLTGGTPATITIPYGPLGVNGTDSNHYLYISGGTGTAEAILITGGTCVSDVLVSCTLSFTPVNSHSGAWTIGSASSGIQEALNAARNILVADGSNLQVFASITPPTNSSISGCGEGGCRITFNSVNAFLFNVINDRFRLQDISLYQVGTAVSGNAAIRASGPRAVSPGSAQWGNLANLFIAGFYNGTVVEGNAQLFNGKNLVVANSVSDGVVWLGAQGYWDAITSLNGGGNGFFNGQTPSIGGSIIFASNIQTFNNKGWGWSSTSNSYISGGNTYLNNDFEGEFLQAINTGASGDSGYLCDANIQFAGQTATWGTNTNGPGVLVQANNGPFRVENCHFFSNQGNDVTFNSPSCTVSGCTMVGGGTGGNAGNIYSVAASGVNSTSVLGNTALTPMLVNGNGTKVIANTVSTNSNTIATLLQSGGTDVIIDDNVLSNAGTAAALQIGGVTYQHSNNIVIGTTTNAGSVSSHSVTL